LPYQKDGVTGCIIGKAIYTGAVDLVEALALAKEG
jgi:phosphoribosylformimino-5-aminoimidazole carboxamide ribonucleotide (ProFAR) isomerase